MIIVRRALLPLAVAFVAAAAVAPATALAQAAIPVAPDDPAYAAVERLRAAGLVDQPLGQRPITRRRMAELARQARAAAGRTGADSAAIGDDLARLWRAAGVADTSAPVASPALRAQPLDRLRVEYLATDARARTIPFNGLSGIDARIDPLVDYRFGRQPLGHGTAFLDTREWIGTPRLSLLAEPRLTLATEPGGVRQPQLLFERLLVAGRVGNAALDVGRDYMEWGQSGRAGMFLSANPGPLDLARLSTDHPAELPWIFRRLGPASATIFVAALGSDYFYPKAHLLGYKVSLDPTPRLELGASYFNISGGRGAPSPAILKRIIESIAFVDLFKNDTTTAFSNKLAGLEARYTFPWRNAQGYAEWDLDDFDWRRPASSFWNFDAGALGGVLVPYALPGAGSVRVEYHHTGARFYQHGEWVSGATVHHRLLGDDLGPDANAGYVDGDWGRTPLGALSIQSAFEERSGDQYKETAVLGAPPVIRKTARLPRERRVRAVAELRRELPGAPAELLVGGGWERVTNFAFVRRDAVDQFVARVQVTIRPR